MLPIKDRQGILAGLLSHSEDATDANLPLLYWYALEPLGGENPKAALELAVNGKIPLLLQFTTRRIATTAKQPEIELLVQQLSKLSDEKNVDKALSILRGMAEGFKGRREVPLPDSWASVSEQLANNKSAEIRSLANSVAISFGDAKALAALRAILSDSKTDPATRVTAIATLVGARDKELPPVLQRLLAEPGLRGPAIRGLAAFDDAKTPAAVLGVWSSLNTAEKRDALSTLSARPVYAKALLDAVGDKRVASVDVTADVVRAMRNLPDKTVAARIAEVWGTVRDTPADRAKAIADLKKKLLEPQRERPDLMLGRALYSKTCQKCHILYGQGGKVGPEITGANRSNLDYLLENILDPSAVIPKDYMPTVYNLTNGRTITGIAKGENVNAITVQTENELLVISKSDIDASKATTVSMMPEDQMKPFSDQEVRALFAYLQSPQQVPMLASVENAKDFFNGKDLTGWIGDPKLWSVEKGEIVGQTATGLKRNEFLKSEIAAENFKLTLKVKLTPDAGNSGVQFRSEALPDGEMRGPQADIGAGWWGKLYEENGRGLLADKGGEKFVKPGEWNDYVVEAREGDVRITINGNVCTDYLKDGRLSRRGVFGLQIHSGGPTEVRFKDLKLEVLPKK